jgi:hypothetical protein
MIDKDLKVAALAFDVDDFQLMNILGNRMMSDSVFLGNVPQAVTGFFIKQVALTYLELKPRIPDPEFLEAKLLGKKYLTYLLEVTDEVDKVKAWANYHQFNVEMRKYPTTGLDKQIAEVYGDEHETTKKVRKSLIKVLDDNKKILLDSRNNFMKGVMTELQRVGLAFGYEVADTIIYSCLIALDRYYDYFRMQHTVKTVEMDKEAVETQIFPYLERIVALSSSDSVGYDNANALLWDLVKGWREFFIYYLEPSTIVSSKQVELSRENKAKLSEVLGKALQKELKTT